MLNMKCLYEYSVGVFMFKFHRHGLPEIFDNFFTRNSSVHGYSTRNSNGIRTPKIRTELAKRFVRYTGAIIWNDIMKYSIPLDKSLITFKKHLKKHLLQKL